MRYLKIFEDFQVDAYPNRITVKFNSNGFIDHYMRETTAGANPGQKIYQMNKGQSNLSSLKERGLEMRKDSFYPIFKNMESAIWYYIVYSGDEINILQSTEHSDRGIEISSNFNSLEKGEKYIPCKFEDGLKPGAIDHRGYFEIVSIS